MSRCKSCVTHEALVVCDNCGDSVCVNCVYVLSRENWALLCPACLKIVCMCCCLPKPLTSCQTCQYRTCTDCLKNGICVVCSKRD